MRHALVADIEAQVGRTVPGMAVIGVTSDGVGLCEGWGLADVMTGVEMTPDTVCNWFSMTKLVTATVAMQLADDGLLDLDAPIVDYYPPFALTRPEARAGAATVRHLLSHSSGLANPLPTRWVHRSTDPAPETGRFVEGLVAKHNRLRFDPGTKAVYSNLGYLVLGQVIEAASGLSYAECVTRRVLEPLDMTRTGFVAVDPTQWAIPYQRRRTMMNAILPVLVPRSIIGPPAGEFRSLRHFYVDGAAYGGLVGPANDAARFLRAHLQDGVLGDTRLLSARSTRAMRTITASGPKFQVGFGWFRRGRHPDASFVEHLGGGAGFWNCMRLYPDQRAGVVIMGNSTSYDHDVIAGAALDVLQSPDRD